MNENTVNFEDFKKEAKKRAIMDKLNKAKDLVVDNKEIILLAASGIKPVYSGVKKLTKWVGNKKEQHDKDTRIFDRSSLKQIKLKRKLNNNDLLTIDKRRQNGESLIDILSDLNLMKN